MTVGDSDVDAAFVAVAERRLAERGHAAAKRAVWLSHHWPDRYERCMVVGGRHVCRRCFWFYGVSFVVMAAGFAGLSPWPQNFDLAMVWLLSVPATVDFVCGELGRCSYNPRRQAIVTIILAAAVGRGFYAELTDQGSWLFWGPALTFGPLWLTAAVVGWLRNTGQYRPHHALGSSRPGVRPQGVMDE